MSDSIKIDQTNGRTEPQCQFFVVRKKRLCRMTVKPGRQYCGEHEPQPKKTDGQDDTRIPCPNDPKHTCYLSKLEKHLSICNARATPQPPYIEHNINAPTEIDDCPRVPLNKLSKDTILKVIEKVNIIYENHIKGQITLEPEHPIHSSVLEEFSESDRTESSLRHLRQLSSLLWLVENEELVQDHTCYMELGAGKGQMSYYACRAWCEEEARGSGALLVDRAALRHKRDNKLRPGAAARLRADLAHLALRHVPAVRDRRAAVALAKHLCGVATDYALRCMTSGGAVHKLAGAVLATCCHHRCERAPYVANKHLLELGITGDDLNVMLGIVSWATCGDGRSRERRQQEPHSEQTYNAAAQPHYQQTSSEQPGRSGLTSSESERHVHNDQTNGKPEHHAHTDQSTRGRDDVTRGEERLVLTQQYREEVGRRAKRLLDWGRVLFLRELGFDARLCYYVPATVSLENVCIVAKKRS